MRIGVAGAGRMGRLHAKTLCDLASVESVVIADPDLKLAADVAGQLGIDHVAGPDGLFSTGIDGLVIAAATDAHAHLTIAAVEAGIPAFCEKPAAPDAASTRAVLNQVSGARVPVQVGFQRRFDAGYLAARAAVRSGRLGWVHTLRAGTFDPAPPTPEYVAVSGGFFRDCSVHDFDVIRWIMGEEVVEVYACGANRGDAFFRDSGDADTIAALLTLTDGTLAHVGASRYNAHGYDVRLEVLGSQASVSVGLDDRLPLESVECGVTFPSGPPHAGFLERFEAAYVAELAAFCDVVAGKAQPASTLEDSLEATLIAEACEISRAEHRPVQMTEVRTA